ncbi:AglZ/HisF2 family acetamidino modification protein [Sulfitobacter sp. 1A12057]|uniref:AglZ/HisF2 family acetamidino modification protein n=1 Tax=Sulfitobacter sp. 1A12057 TaxID=3368567 RepID=UPI0037477DD4
MLRPRLIPCLLVHKNGLVKTVKFSDPKYVGDPINAVRIFNEKQVDELMVLDIDATVQGCEPNFDLISKLSTECRMPLSYGGGVQSVEQIERIIGLGVEKVAMSAQAIANPDIIGRAAERVGSQSLVVVVDIRHTGWRRRSEVVTHNATRRTGMSPEDAIRLIEEHGAGEIVINNVDRDGTMEGYDLALIERLCAKTTLPVTVLGGAGQLDDIAELWQAEGLVGAACGSLFVFKGRYRAVLINYPNTEEKTRLLSDAGWVK